MIIELVTTSFSIRAVTAHRDESLHTSLDTCTLRHCDLLNDNGLPESVWWNFCVYVFFIDFLRNAPLAITGKILCILTDPATVSTCYVGYLQLLKIEINVLRFVYDNG